MRLISTLVALVLFTGCGGMGAWILGESNEQIQPAETTNSQLEETVVDARGDCGPVTLRGSFVLHRMPDPGGQSGASAAAGRVGRRADDNRAADRHIARYSGDVWIDPVGGDRTDLDSDSGILAEAEDIKGDGGSFRADRPVSRTHSVSGPDSTDDDVAEGESWMTWILIFAIGVVTGLIGRHPIRAYNWVVEIINRLRGKEE